MHGAADSGAHAGGDDLHVHPAPRGGRLQPPPPDLQHGIRVAAQEDEQDHRAGLGLQHSLGHPSFLR